MDHDLRYPNKGLYPRELSEHCRGPPLECYHCKHVIDGRYVYCNEESKIFLHKLCAEVHTWKQIPHHPCHSQHPLTLTLQQDSREEYTCGICNGSYPHDIWLYTCESCDVKLHASCAAGTLPDNENEVRLQRMTHIHEHPLFSLSVKLKNKFCCRVCRDFIYGEAYACYQCRIFFHKVCIDVPREIQHHPFHPHHHLKLVVDGSDLSYSCKECGSTLPFEMSTLISTLPRKEEDDFNEEESQSAINHFAHEHPLNPFHATKEIDYECKACAKPIVNGSYGCIDCRFLIHESCAKAPSEIQHYLHTNHTLSLIPQPESYCRTCENCASYILEGFAYHCKACQFSLHMECALKTLAYLEEGATTTVQHSSHWHELTLAHPNDSSFLRRGCNVCAQPQKGPMYKCRTEVCKFVIHKSCEELPSTVQQSFHPHPFTLRPENSVYRPTCDDCGKTCGPYLFSCAECQLNFDVVCALWERSTLKDHLHEHNLFYCGRRPEKSSCKICGKPCNVDLFFCNDCKICVHYDCAHLPSKIMVSKFHVDPLTLHESIVEDDQEENYCDICEGKRDPELWAYYCVRPSRMKEIKENPELRWLNEKIECVQQEIEDMEANLKKREESLVGPMVNLEVLKTKHAEVEYFGVVLLRHPSHPHHALHLRELGAGCRPLGLPRECCRVVILSGFVYCCDECKYFLHKPCGEKDEAELLVDESGKECGTLSSTMSTLTSTLPCKEKDGVREEEKTRSAIQHFAQQHPHDPYHAAPGIDSVFYGGIDWFSIYMSCLELPSIIQQSSHSHPLALRREEYEERPTCSACGRECGHFMFSCAECKINLHAVCAFLERPTLTEGFHKHDLFYVVEGWEKSQCKVCGKQCSMDFFCCQECGASVHYGCVHLLSKIVGSNHHIHPLTLYNYVVEDDNGEYIVKDDSEGDSREYIVEDDYKEQNYDICGEGRDPKLWAYYCAECHLVAHVKCATSPVRLNFSKQKAELRQLEKEIGRVQTKMDAIIVEVKERKESLKAKGLNFKALEEKRKDLASQSKNKK